ncbi:flagellar hook-associated protein FlgL [Spirochaetia bacterium]|nr:flagellar hook-associated protein FlgL [Spirochaetia bacterium]
MRRVSTQMPNTDLQYYLRRQEEGIAHTQKMIETQKGVLNLRDDPMAASHAVRYESYLSRLERFEKNTLSARDHYNQVDGYIKQANEVLQRVRELTVLGANGTNGPDELNYIGREINELLKELVSVSNAVGKDGKQIFAGDKAFTEPFRIVEGTVQGAGESVVVRVEYRGAGPARRTEISEQNYADLDLGGGEVFWAEKMQIYSGYDATDYRVTSPGAFILDGVEINVTPGDTLPSIVAKINEASAPVKAYIDPDSRGLVLEGTNAHLIRLEDKEGSQVMQDLGMITANNDPSAPNWNPSAKVAGGSIFDMVIRVRDALFRGDQDFIGSQGIGGMDLALTNIQSRLATVGSRYERAEMTWNRLNDEIPRVAQALSNETGLDMATALTDLAMMDFAHKASLQVGARIIPPTLLDFLR